MTVDHPARFAIFLFSCLVGLASIRRPVEAAELTVLTPENWEEYAPQGKEVDCIYGDYVLRNDFLAAVVAKPIKGRNANMTVRQVGGAVIDLTERHRQSDQLSAFYPGAREYEYQLQGMAVDGSFSDKTPLRGESVELRLISPVTEGRPEVELIYSLRDGEPYVRVTSIHRNPSKKPLEVRCVDEMRTDRTFEKAPDGEATLFWVYDKWFGQAYGLLPEGRTVSARDDGRDRATTLLYPKGGQETIPLKPGEDHRLLRYLFPKAHLIDVKSVAALMQGQSLVPVSVSVVESDGTPVPEADIVIAHNGEAYGNARTPQTGRVELVLPPGRFRATASALGRGSREMTLEVKRAKLDLKVELPVAPRVVARITDEAGKPVACKVQFVGVEGTESPDFGPDSGEHAVRNLYYSHNGRVTQILPPGKYQVIVSHGPEYDAVFKPLQAAQGQKVSFEATLKRVVKTPGWVSADFHSHSSPSGDNTTSQLGRVLNLVAEHIEFAPCTEHNRLSTYAPHLKKLGIEGVMASAVGIELTGSPLPVDHQNAFPLVLKPYTQDGGGPLPDEDPQGQIQRLALWDGGSEKLVQQNHPDIGWIFFDKDADGQPDGGFKGMFGYMDVVEVHPLDRILTLARFVREGDQIRNHRVFNWLQLLNQGYRIPGVVNTDAHYTFHGSGWLRNYMLSPTDDPAQIGTLDIVHAAEHGHVVMTNGPFLEVKATVGAEGQETRGTAGDELRALEGRLALQVGVQCPNWLDIDRVQILVNGRPDPKLNFTRSTTPERFSGGVVKFDQEIPIELAADAHLIVVAIGENSKLGAVMGPERGEAPPVAVSNPIYVDVDGDGFKPNGDTLGWPLPVKVECRADELSAQ